MDWTTATQVLTTTSSATVIGCSSNYILVLQNSALLYKLQRVFLRNPTSLSLWTNLCVSNSTANDMSNVSFIAANFMMATFIAKRINLIRWLQSSPYLYTFFAAASLSQIKCAWLYQIARVRSSSQARAAPDNRGASRRRTIA